MFVGVNAFGGLGWAAVAAVATGLLVLVVRVARGGRATYAFGGLLGVGGAVALALFLGRAEAYFLPGIIANIALAGIGVASVLARKPLLAWGSMFFRRWPSAWYWRPDVRPAYTEVTWFWIAFWAIRAASQLSLFNAGRPELLATVKLAMSWPTAIPLVVVSYLYGTWRLRTLSGPSVEEFRAGTEPPWQGQRSGF